MDIKISTIKNGIRNNYVLNTPFINAVLDIISAAYLDYSNIEIANPMSCNEIDALGSFLTYVLAYPPNVKTPIVKVKENLLPRLEIRPNFNLKKITIVCFSGGIDSTGALLHLLESGTPVVALWCDYGQPYNNLERSAVRNICMKLSVQLFESYVDLSALIARGEKRFGHVFPARNLLIAAIAAALKPKSIILAGLSDELIVPDKSLRMYSEAPNFLGCPLYSPFVKMSKAEVLTVWKKRWNKLLHADETVSCYDKGGNCQNCAACAKREVALISSQYSDKLPRVFINQAKLIENHWFSRIDVFQPSRRDEILIALGKFKNYIPSSLKKLVEDNYFKYMTEVQQWQEHLVWLSDIIY